MTGGSPFGMTGTPGANFAGTNMPVPTTGSSTTPSVGGTNSPFTPAFPGGTQTPPITSSINAAPTGTTAPSNPSNFNLSSLLGFGNDTSNPLHDITKALGKAGFSAGVAGELANFLANGAGFNPAVAQALIAAMQPQVQNQQAQILEQFGSQGMRDSSNAALGLSNYMSQVNLNEGEIWANLYEQSVQNYMNVLLAGKQSTQPKGSMFQNLMQYMNTAANATSSAAAMAG